MSKEPTKRSIDEYWKKIIGENTSHPKKLGDDVHRLVDSLISFYYQEKMYDISTGREDGMSTLEDFWDSKRPYGNKDIERSIMYRLGWDRERYLHLEYFPEFAKELCMNVHDMVKKNLDFEQERIDDNIERFREDQSLLLNILK